MNLVIDISQWQDPSSINYDAIAKQIKGVMIRAGYTGWGDGVSRYYDNAAERHYAEFSRRGVPCGFYWFSCANTRAKGKAEAESLLRFVRGKKIGMPLVIDVEDIHHQMGAGKGALADAILGFCDEIEGAGYWAAVYSSTSWFKDQIDDSRLQGLDHWLAHWTNDPDMEPPYKGASIGLWQYSEGGTLTGYNGAIDVNKRLKDYPALIEGKAEKVKAGPIKQAEATFDASWWRSKYSVFHRKNVRYTCLIDPAKVQAGELSGITKRYRAKTWEDPTFVFPEAYVGHIGVDTAAEHLAPVYAGCDGRVIECGYSKDGSGNFVQVQTGPYRILFCHFSEVKVTKGQTVTPTTIVGLQGSTGWSTGSHLHVSIWLNNRLIDPLDFILGAKTFDGSAADVPPPEVKTQDFNTGIYTVNTSLNMRTAPIKDGQGGEVKGTLESGSWVTVLEVRKDDGFKGAWGRIADDLWICLQDQENVYVSLKKASAENGEIWHVVEAGQTPWSIAQDYGTTSDEIERLNNLSGNYVIYAGQKLRVK